MMLEQERLLPLLNDTHIVERVKLESFLMVSLGVRPAGELVVPGEIPGGRQLAEAVDGVFTAKYYRGTRPDSGPLGNILDRVRYAAYRAVLSPIDYKAFLIRETFDEVLEHDDNYAAHLRWAKELGLEVRSADLRPSLRDVFIVAREASLQAQALLRFRRALRKRHRSPDMGADEPTTAVFPEQHSSRYVRALGRLLGYPECCVDQYVSARQAGAMPELRGAEELIAAEAEGLEVADEVYFVRDFVPCSPTCEHARVLGESAHEALAQTDPVRLVPRYRALLQANRQHLKEYPRVLREHRERLKRKLRETERPKE